MPGLTDVVQAINNIGAAARSARADADDARASQEALNDEIDATARRETTSRLTGPTDTGTDTKKLGAALQASRGRV